MDSEIAPSSGGPRALRGPEYFSIVLLSGSFFGVIIQRCTFLMDSRKCHVYVYCCFLMKYTLFSLIFGKYNVLA